MRFVIALLLSIGFAGICSAGQTAEFPLARDGKPAATIVIAAEPTATAALAAQELQYHVKKITGATLPIVSDETELTGPRILVGRCKLSASMRLDADDLCEQEYVIRFRDDVLALTGREPADKDVALHTPRDTAKSTLSDPRPSLFNDNGTLYAVYDFLERFCDVRWYAPGEIGLVCPKTTTLIVRGGDVRRRPAMKHRWITPTALYLPAPPQSVPDQDLYLWKQRMRIGGQAFTINHSFYGYYDRYLKTHPEWFAQGYEGRPPQMCYTNPEFINQVVADARDFFDGKAAKSGAAAAGDVFGLVPMDNCSWCKCPRCQKELNQVDQNNPQFNNGKASDYVYGFVNKVAREVRKTHPRKWIGALAYSDYAYYPTKEPVEKNVIVQLCLHTRNWWCPSMEANDRKTLAEWRGRDPDRPLYAWLYYNFPAFNGEMEKFHYFPGYFAHAAVAQMRWYQAADVQGIFMEHSSEFNQSYLADQLEFYVTLKLADDPTLDGNRLIDEFFDRYYGAAGKPMKELYSAIEATFWDPRNYPPEVRHSPGHQHQTRHLAREVLTTKERMKHFAELMEQAKQAAATPEEKQRVALFEQGQWEYMLEGAKAENK